MPSRLATPAAARLRLFSVLNTSRPARALVWAAIGLLPFALGLDVLDGYVARLQPSRQSRLGADLDSLADVISFGVAPAVIGYALGLRGGWDMLCLTYFIVCGVSRLARFNVTARNCRTNGPVKSGTSRGRRFPPASSSSACWRLRWGRSRSRGALARQLPHRPGGAAPADAALRGQRQRDDQRDVEDSKAIAWPLSRPAATRHVRSPRRPVSSQSSGQQSIAQSARCRQAARARLRSRHSAVRASSARRCRGRTGSRRRAPAWPADSRCPGAKDRRRFRSPRRCARRLRTPRPNRR